MKKFLFVILIFFCAFTAYSNDPISQNQITGRVVDEKNQPLAGVNVTIENTLIGVATDHNGNFKITVKQGHYNLVFTFIGYKRSVISVDVPSTSEILVQMETDAILSEEVIVSATRASSRMPIAYTNIPKEDLKSINNGFDIPYLLELTPSVVATSEGGTGIGNTAIRIRGTDMTRINVTVNGIPLNDSESHGVYWVNMPDFASSVDNVQVQRGVGTSTNGAAAFGATVNFQTVTLEPKAYANVEAMGGSFGTFKTNARVGTGLINNAFSFEGRYTALQSNGYIDRGWSNHKSLFATGAWHRQNSLLRFNLIHGEQHTGITWEGTPSDSLLSNRTFNPAGMYLDNSTIKFYDNESDNYTQTHYQILYSQNISSKITINANVHYTKGVGFYEQYKPDQKFSKYGLPSITIGNATFSKTDLIRQKWLDNYFYGFTLSSSLKTDLLTATVGGGWNQYDGDHFGRILWTKVNSSIPKNYEWYRNNSIKTDMNVYAKAISEAINNFTLFGDFQLRRIEYNMAGPDDDLAPLDQKHSWDFFNPKAGLTYNIGSNSNAYFSFGIANREPARADLKDALKWDSSHTPKAEQLYDYEMGYAFKSQKVQIGVNFYFMNYKDQLVLTGKLSEVGYALMENVPQSYRTGVEVSWGILPVKELKWVGSFTLSQNKILDYTDYVDQYNNDTDWEPIAQKETFIGRTNISFSPSVIASSQLSYDINRNFGISYIAKYVGKQFIDNTSSSDRMLDDYLVCNLKIDYKLRVSNLTNARIEFFVNNLFNQNYVANAWVYRAAFANNAPDYREDGFYPQAGINFMARIALEF
jgi:iron complex outermembrane receptor protein